LPLARARWARARLGRRARFSRRRSRTGRERHAVAAGERSRDRRRLRPAARSGARGCGLVLRSRRRARRPQSPDRGSSLRPLIGILVAVALLCGGTSALAAPAGTLRATYDAAPPTQIPAGSAFTVAVTVSNVGTDSWSVSGASPINLSYHWIDGGGASIVWDGVRTPLGADVAPGAQRTVQAQVLSPATPGSYFLLFALVQEGVGWLPPSTPYPLAAITAYQATFGQVTLPSFISGGTYQVTV